MKKLLVAGGALAGAAFAARRCMAKCGRIDFEKMIERMPESAPPKWMFRNISAIRENTERILERLDSGHPGEETPQPQATNGEAQPVA
ncbi:MAG: hypothetical protein ACXVZO_07285 [Gaiellaceae bacterium]